MHLFDQRVNKNFSFNFIFNSCTFDLFNSPKFRQIGICSIASIEIGKYRFPKHSKIDSTRKVNGEVLSADDLANAIASMKF